MWSCFSKHTFILSVLLLLTITFAIVQAQDDINKTATSPLSLQQPSEYFGGSDHDTYLTWYETVSSKYTGSAFIYDTSTKNSTNNNNTTTTAANSKYGVAVHWYVDESYVYIGVATRAQDGWVAFGLAEVGGMKGSDIVIYETSKPNTLSDAHVLKDRVPILDLCQDWVYIDAVNAGGFLIFEGKRLLDTKDGQDHPIINDTETFIPAQRVIAAWGDATSSMMYHGPTNRVRGAIRLYGTGDEATKFQSLIAESDGYFDLIVNNHTLDNITTAYVDFCFNWDTDVIPQGGIPSNTNIYVVAAETILDKNGGGSFVHHASITASSTPLLNASRTCLDLTKYDFFLYSWTPGTFPLVFPQDVGITLGPNDGAIQSFRLQMHYNNPLLLNGITDSSGLRVHYKFAAPTYEAGILPMGDILTSLEGTPLNSGTSRFDFSCSDECSTLVLDQEPVTVIGEFFHMHNRGSAAVQYQIRNNQVIRQANVNFFDFDQAGMYAFQ
jgi:DOMON domain/Copper type II ascorbate-dependent monooxygenase, N-terminal domain/Copper type II ascorbate-dependent monooxygenase, C-terminal domain